jgi:hypothetical protein
MRLSLNFLRAGAGRMLLLGMLLGGGSTCRGQEALLPAAPEQALLPVVDFPGPTEEAPCDDDAAPKAKDPWAKVPPVYPWPPLGWMFIRPNTPGYYSLRDVLTDTWRPKRPTWPWPPFGLNIIPFFDANFQSLHEPNGLGPDWIFDNTKRLHPCPDWMFSIGGEERLRWENQMDDRLTGKDNSYVLERSRVFGDLWYRDLFRVYVEYLDAQSTSQTLPPLAIDIEKNDLLNAFVDLKIGEAKDNPIYFRIGRQELIYGSERLITSKDWANILQNFQGIKAYWRSDNLDLDAFWVEPVIPNPNQISSPDPHQGFAGLWGTYRPDKNSLLDLYVLNLEYGHQVSYLAAPGGRGGYNVTTLGTRSYGEEWNILWDFELMYQTGMRTSQQISAGAWVTGMGYHFAKLPMNPSFWIYDEFASGSRNPGHGSYGTFNQLFPYGHYYFGWIDDVGRENINDINMELQVYPLNWITMFVQYHVFRLASAYDALYNASGIPIRRDPTGRAGTDVGDELDWVLNFHLDLHHDILLGYSTLFAGEFIKRTGPPGSPDFFFLQYSFRW